MSAADPRAAAQPDPVARAFDHLADAMPADHALRELIALYAEACAERRGVPPLEARWRIRSLAPPAASVECAPIRSHDAVRTRARGALSSLPREAFEPDALGDAYESLQRRTSPEKRKLRGSYFTPRGVAEAVVAQALARWNGNEHPLDVLDPAMGGGRFLLEARRARPDARLHGVDIDPLAVWVARLALFLVGDVASSLESRLRHADALHDPLPDADVVIGNPPWVAYAGRQTVKLDDATREQYRKRYRAFAGFPTLHGMFVERAAEALRTGGRLALLLPTQVTDLRGYGPMREALTARARVLLPLGEIGFGAFDGVIEPTVLLLADRDGEATPSGSPWALRENTGRKPIGSPRVDAIVERLRALASFPSETFGEAGFQTQRGLADTHLGAWPGEPRFSVPLREGRDVEPFFADTPRIALDPDPETLARLGVRLRTAAQFAAVRVVIRQTARFPIAAVHEPPHAFRNSLLAGYTDNPELLVALLNSTVLRAFHLASQRDGRQAVFPQLKVAHLRALPAPPSRSHDQALVDRARKAAAAQRARGEVWERLRASLGEELPASLLSPRGGEIPVRDRYAKNPIYLRALDEARAHWSEFVTVASEIDALVAEAYGVTGEDLEALRAVLVERV